MKFNQPLLTASVLAASSLALSSCYRQAPCEHTPGVAHAYGSNQTSQAWSQGAPGQRINTLATAPGPEWFWLDGCWYWNNEDWVWLSQQWMPPGGTISYMGPEDSGRDDYCVYTPGASEPLPVAMPWPPDVNYGRTTQIVVVHGDYGTRRPQGWHDYNLPPSTVRDHRDRVAPPLVRDHRGAGRRNEVVPATRGTAPVPGVRDPRNQAPVIDLVAPPPREPSPPAPPTGPHVNRQPTAPATGPIAPPRPPVIHRPARPTGGRTTAPAPNRAAPGKPPQAPSRGTRPTPPPAPPRAAAPRPTAPPPGRVRAPAPRTSSPAPKTSSPAPSRGSRPSPRPSQGSSRRPR